MSSSSTTPEAGQQPEPTPSPLPPEQKLCGRTLPHLPHDEHTRSGHPCPGVPLSPEEAAEADAIWAERDRRIAARCHVNLDGHRNVNGHCLYCSKPMAAPEALSPERLDEIRVKLAREARAHGSVHYVPPTFGMVRDLLAEVDRIEAGIQAAINRDRERWPEGPEAEARLGLLAALRIVQGDRFGVPTGGAR